ncbi:MAG: hypothetical protein IJQ23_03735 [Clostridia bacterium]|nr:hypothetical protein [Clostridia bacterium]
MGLDLNEKYKYINSLVELKEKRLKNSEQALVSAEILYENYKSVKNKDARVIENLIKEIHDCKKAIKGLNEEIRLLMTEANQNVLK